MKIETLDVRSIKDRPDLFTAVACSGCEETAARWVHEVSVDTWCDACESAHEAVYTAEGGQ